MSAPSTLERAEIRPSVVRLEETAAHPRRRRRIIRSILNQWITHLTLLVLAGIFFFPFVWMFGMSLKTDEEVSSTDVFPALPEFTAASPYVIPSAAVDRPEMASRELWNRLWPELLSDASAAVATAPLPAGVFDSDVAALRQSAAIEAARQAVQWVDPALWNSDGNETEIRRQYQNGLAHTDLASILENRLARLELGPLQVRSISGHVKPIEQTGNLWKVVSGNADLISIPSAGVQALRYHFADASAAPVVLQASFDGGIAAADLLRLVVAYKGDGSWNHVDADVTLGSQHYTSYETSYIAQHRGASILLQPPTFQDQTLGPRTWVSLVPAGSGDASPASSSPTGGSITLKLYPSSTLRAMWGKFQRNYTRAFRAAPFWTYVANSLIVVILQLAGVLFSSGFVAYAFTRLRWPGRALSMGLLLATMMLPSQVTMIPSFLIWRDLGWYNTLNPLWVGAWLGNAFFIFLTVQHMRTIPRELDEAARIDGMNEFQVWWYVMMPQVKPTLAAISIMTFMGSWNEFMQPLILLRDQTKFTLGLGLFAMRLDANVDWPLIMAGNLLMILPVIVIFFLFQKYFIEGVTVTGMKG
jgi:ABC-type glycerol-3-phosphate transport system permease component